MNPDSSSYFQPESDIRHMAKRKITFSYYLMRFWLAGRHDNPMPELTLSPQSGIHEFGYSTFIFVVF
jgi:hypothetical protein